MSKYNGFLVVNPFIDSEKFKDLYDLLLKSAKTRDVSLSLCPTDRLIRTLGDEKDLCVYDFAIFWDKDVNLCYRLEKLGLPVFNGSRSICACDDKSLTLTLLAENGIPHPPTVVAPKTFEGLGYNSAQFLFEAEKLLGYPMIIKESFGSFGKQVYLAKDREEGEEILKKVGYKPIILQKFIKSSRGKDIRVNVVGKKVVSAMERYNENDFRSNLTLGGKAKQITLSKEWTELSLKVAKILNLDYCGIDLLYGENGEAIVCEVNSNPHFRTALDCTGVNLADEIMDHIMEKLK